jgi:hypothetical protein
LKSDRERSRSRKRGDGRRGSNGKGKGKEGVVDDDVVDDDDDEKVERTDGRGEGEDEVLMVDVGEEIIDRAAAIIASLAVLYASAFMLISFKVDIAVFAVVDARLGAACATLNACLTAATFAGVGDFFAVFAALVSAAFADTAAASCLTWAAVRVLLLLPVSIGFFAITVRILML